MTRMPTAFAAAIVLALAGEGRAAPCRVDFTVVPAELPTNATVYLSGNHPSLGNWNAAGVAMQRKTDGRWTKGVDVETGARIEFKVTLGSWGTEALDAKGAVPPNHVLDVTCGTGVLIRVARWKNETNPPQSHITGTVKVHRKMEYDGLLPRDVIVWLPPGYDANPTNRYPVLYMHDARQVFDPATSTHGIDWGVDETVTRLIAEKKMREIIIVAVDCTADRMEEYSDTEKGDLYAAFLVNRLKPFIDWSYRTMPDPENTAVIGSSMGGRMSFLLAWNHPQTFMKAGCLSSAFFGDLPQKVERYPSATRSNIVLYLDNGGVGLDRDLQPGNDWMLEALQKKGFVLGSDLYWFCDPSAEHNEAAWAKRVWMPLLLFFGIGEQQWAANLPPPPAPAYAERDAAEKPIERLRAFAVAGVETRGEEDDFGGRIVSACREFDRQKADWSGAGEWVGVVDLDYRTKQFDFLAGAVIGRNETAPAGWTTREIPAARYLVIRHAGSMASVRETLDYAVNWCVPRSGLEPAGPILVKPGSPIPDLTNIVYDIYITIRQRK